jgi:hypothetical protein
VKIGFSLATENGTVKFEKKRGNSGSNYNPKVNCKSYVTLMDSKKLLEDDVQ